MRKFTFLALAFIWTAIGATAADSELTNYKTGIDVVWDGTKGSAYQEEYWYYDKLRNDTKTVFLRSDTSITLSHNARNMVNRASASSDRQHVLYTSGNAGQIRYEIDRIWDKSRHWGPPQTSRKPAYTAPFTLSSAGVVGVTGWSGSYWRGMTETVGTGTEEWHVLLVADDDEARGGGNDSSSNDGKYILLVVNPVTPAATWRASGSGQFYTTPAWTYWVPKIHAQTTYLQGTVTCELRNIYGGNISYRINGGSTVSVGAATVTLDQDDFSSGSNTLEYWYTSTPTVIRTRTVVKNPTHPGAAESHGELQWGPGSWALFQSRATREPYSGRIAAAQLPGSGSGQACHTDWDATRNQGRRWGGSNWPYHNYGTSTNATIARHLGWSATRSGAPRSYAAYAKEMLLDTELNQHPVGMEASFWASYSIASPDLYYRGYWDVGAAFRAASAYDTLMSGYRSDQVAGGITPIEDYFIRDRMADYVHQCALLLGGFASPTDTGMWSCSRLMAAAQITVVMPKYSTPYFGTSGMDGNTTVFRWAPFQTNNYTWKKLFIRTDYALSTFGHGPILPFGLEGPYNSLANGALIRPPLGGTPFNGTNGPWVDKVDYASYSQMGGNIYLYANLQAVHDTLADNPNLVNYINEITAGTLRGSKNPTGPVRQHAIITLNSRFPQAVANASAWIKSLPADDTNSDDSGMVQAGLGGLYLYDDGLVAGPSDTVKPTVAITLPTTQPTYSTTAPTIALSGTASDNTGVTSVTWTNSAGGSGTATGTTSWSVPSLTLQTGTNTLTVTARDAAGNQTSTSLAVTYTGVEVPQQPIISPAGGNFATPQTVTLTTATSGATIYYTTDGSTPTTASNRYSDPLVISASATLKAIAATSATNVSPVATASFRFDEYVSSPTWQSVALPSAQTGHFTISWIATPIGGLINAVTGLSSGPATSYADLACIVRLNDGGFIDARNGSEYMAEQSMPYSAGTSYRVSMTVDVAARTYDVIVTPAGGSPVVIAVAYAFRSEQASVATLDHLSFFSDNGSHSLGEILLSPASGPPIGPSGLGLTL